MHSHTDLLSLQRTTSNEDYRYGKRRKKKKSIKHDFDFSDYFTAAVAPRGRPPSTTGYDIPSKACFISVLFKFFLI